MVDRDVRRAGELEDVLIACCVISGEDGGLRGRGRVGKALNRDPGVGRGEVDRGELGIVSVVDLDCVAGV